MSAPLVLVNAVGMTSRLLEYAPRMRKWAEQGWVRPLREVMPAVTSTAQATILTGQTAEGHGIVANGWLFRDTMEVRFWQQCNHLLQAEPLYVTARKRAAARGKSFRCAKLFWWFNQGAAVDFSVTPKPYYGADGNKAFGITGRPFDLPSKLEKELGKFPFPSFWGPLAGLPSTRWIARCAAIVLRDHQPDLTLVYLPHLDYEPQRQGPSGTDMARGVQELDDTFAPMDEAARRTGARVWIVSEYGHTDVKTPVFPNRLLRREGLLAVRGGPFGEMLETFESDAFAVCDHQLAHVYVREPHQLPRVREVLAALPGVARVFAGAERQELGLAHPRAGELILLAQPHAWFAYPYWLEDRHAPDFARTVDIHRKPGFDPCELFFDPKISWPKGRMLWRLFQKKLGLRTLFDVIPLNAGLVRGSHGLAAAAREDRPLLLGSGPAPSGEDLPMTAVRDLVLAALGLPE
jgi:predicted AlkP superfamily pyrophosphatase or phosphodiesterase